MIFNHGQIHVTTCRKTLVLAQDAVHDWNNNATIPDMRHFSHYFSNVQTGQNSLRIQVPFSRYDYQKDWQANFHHQFLENTPFPRKNCDELYHLRLPSWNN
jgi:hypothetical protein